MKFGYVENKDCFQITALYTAFDQNLGSDYYFAGECHNFWELVIVTEGEIGVTAGSDVLVLRKNQAIIHEPMEFHRLWSEGNSPASIIIFSFAATKMPKYPNKTFELTSPHVPANLLSQIKDAFETSFINVTGVRKGSDIKATLAIKNLEVFLLELMSQKLESSNHIKSRIAKNYSTIIKILEENQHKNLLISDIAKMCNMSEVNLKKTFAKYSGMGVMNYFNQLKIYSAITMLRNGKTVCETANSLGFSNQNYFSTVFKRITGKSPSNYIKEEKASQ